MLDHPTVQSKRVRTVVTIACSTIASAALMKLGINVSNNANTNAPAPKTTNNGDTSRELEAEPPLKATIAPPEKMQPLQKATPKRAVAPPKAQSKTQSKTQSKARSKPDAPQLENSSTKLLTSEAQAEYARLFETQDSSVADSSVADSSPETIQRPEASPTQDSDSDPSPSIALPREKFLDTTGHWAQYFIESLTLDRIVQGYPDGRFYPDIAVTPGQFAAMTQRSFQESPIRYADLQSFVSKAAPTRAEAALLIHQTRAKAEPVTIVTSLRVRGEVISPGDYSLAGLSDPTAPVSQRLPTIVRAIQQAGGISRDADLSQVQVVRSMATGQKRVITLDLQSLVMGGNSKALLPNPSEPRTAYRGEDFLLEQNDEIIIPTAKNRSIGVLPK